MKNLALQRLIYGMTNTIVIESTGPKEVVTEIEAVRSSMAIEGFIFRPGFANTTELTDYTEADWAAMYAQYSLTYGWSTLYTARTGNNPVTVLDAYFTDLGNIFSPLEVAPKAYYVAEPVFYEKVLTDIAESKIVLRTHQIEILNLMPIEILAKIYENVVFTIIETRILFLKRLITEGKEIAAFTTPEEIVKFVIAVFPKNTEPYTGQVTNDILKAIEVKIPTSMRKVIVRSIQKMSYFKAIRGMKKNKNFWKRLFKQLAWQSEEKMIATARFQNYLDIKGTVFNETIITPRSDIEQYRREGNLETAFIVEMKNTGGMLRNLMSYLRYPIGSTYAKKVSMAPDAKEHGIAMYFNKKVQEEVRATVVHSDITNVLASDEFMKCLTQANSKLLWQVLTLLQDKKNTVPKSVRVVNDTKIKYSKALPGIDPKMTELAKKAIKKAIKKVKRAENASLGKVYIDKTLKNYAMQFSGRSETSISLSGEYLSPGSKIDLTDLLKGEDKILRMGIAWTGASCDVDHALNIFGMRSIYYGNPTLADTEGRVVISSSGDITSCSPGLFSTEIIDIDVDQLATSNVEKIFNSAHMFAGPTFDKIECYWFMNIIDKKDRILEKRKVAIALDAMQYAIKLQEPTRAQVGFSVDLKKKELEVLNLPSKQSQYNNAATCKEDFEKLLAERPKQKSLYKAMKTVIAKDQLTDNILEADLIISAEPDQPAGITVLHPGRDAVALQEIIF